METGQQVKHSEKHVLIESTPSEARAFVDTYLQDLSKNPPLEKPIRPISGNQENLSEYDQLSENFYKDQYAHHFSRKLESSETPETDKDLIRIFVVEHMMMPDARFIVDDARQDMQVARLWQYERSNRYREELQNSENLNVDLENCIKSVEILTKEHETDGLMGRYWVVVHLPLHHPEIFGGLPEYDKEREDYVNLEPTSL